MRFEFNPKEGFEDEIKYPNPTSGKETRRQFMTLLNQLKDYINGQILNTFVESITSQDGSLRVSKEGSQYDLQVIVTSTGVTKKYVDEQDINILDSAGRNATAYADDKLREAKQYTDTAIANEPNVYSGTGEPSSDLGKNGDIYVKYE